MTMATKITDTPPAVLDLIGNTPIIEVTRFDTGCCQLFLKLESQNPGGSIKDRIALSMIETAEKQGHLKPGGMIIEATAGNTGLGLALVARAKGYAITLVVPDKMSSEKIQQLKALGAQVYITRSDVGKGHPEYYQDYADRLAHTTPGAFYTDQFNNPANPLAHERGTGPEIWQQMQHNVDAIVCGVGSAGTVTGLTHFFRELQPNLEFVLADPKGSILARYIETKEISNELGSWAVEGIGEDFIPGVADFSRVQKAYTIDDKESFATARALLHHEGILAGSSTGTLLAAALRYCREQKTPKRVLTFVCDTGTRYLSKVYNDDWMMEQGLLERQQFGDLRDLIAPRHTAANLPKVAQTDTLFTALQRIQSTKLAQLPVFDNQQFCGLITISDLLQGVTSNINRERPFQNLIAGHLSRKVQTLAPTSHLAALQQALNNGLTAIIADDTHFYGLITEIDLLNYLRKKFI